MQDANEEASLLWSKNKLGQMANEHPWKASSICKPDTTDCSFGDTFGKTKEKPTVAH